MTSSPLPVLTAVTGAPWEAGLVAALEDDRGVQVVRRCVDLADLLASAAAGTARAALLFADLRRLDRDALARLAAADVAVVGLTAPGDDAARQRLHQLGVAQVLPADAAPAAIVGAVVAAVTAEATDATGAAGAAGAADVAGAADAAGAARTAPRTSRRASFSEPSALPADLPDPADPVGAGAAQAGLEPGTGRVVAVWGPTGAPGRTTLAVGLASETAALGVPTLLADADAYGGVVAQVLGLLDEAPGLAAAARLANAGTLDLLALARIAPVVDPHLRVLTGISRADRWPELRPSALAAVYAVARSLAAVTVVDCGFGLEQDEELAFDTVAPRRNGATLLTVAEADVVVAVGSADPVGVQRLVRGLGELREAAPGAEVRVVLNRVRRGPVGPDPERQLAQALERYAGVTEPAFVPYDRAGLDAVAHEGRWLASVAAGSPARAAIADLAAALAGRPRRTRRRPRLRRGA